MADRIRLEGPLLQALKPAIDTLARAHQHRDLHTCNHQERVAEMAVAIATLMHLPESRIELLFLAGRVHDIGKLAIPSEITYKPGKLSGPEFALMQTHCEAGRDILAQLRAPVPLAEIVYQHHERMDGSGYPHGLAGSVIIKEAQILAVADSFDAMSSYRPYRAALSEDFVLGEIRRMAGISLDRNAADACIQHVLGAKWRLADRSSVAAVNGREC